MATKTKKITRKLNKAKLDKTFEKFDLLGLKSFAEVFTKHIIAEYPYVESSLVISLNGGFGRGKSCFLEMFKNHLEVNQKCDVIYINSWKNDFFNEPIITIVSEILDHLDKQKSVSQKILNSLKDNLYMIAGSYALSVNQLVDKITGINIKENVEQDIEKRDLRLGNAIFKEYI